MPGFTPCHRAPAPVAPTVCLSMTASMREHGEQEEPGLHRGELVLLGHRDKSVSMRQGRDVELNEPAPGRGMERGPGMSLLPTPPVVQLVRQDACVGAHRVHALVVDVPGEGSAAIRRRSWGQHGHRHPWGGGVERPCRPWHSRATTSLPQANKGPEKEKAAPMPAGTHHVAQGTGATQGAQGNRGPSKQLSRVLVRLGKHKGDARPPPQPPDGSRSSTNPISDATASPRPRSPQPLPCGWGHGLPQPHSPQPLPELLNASGVDLVQHPLDRGVCLLPGQELVAGSLCRVGGWLRSRGPTLWTPAEDLGLMGLSLVQGMDRGSGSAHWPGETLPPPSLPPAAQALVWGAGSWAGLGAPGTGCRVQHPIRRRGKPGCSCPKAKQPGLGEQGPDPRKREGKGEPPQNQQQLLAAPWVEPAAGAGLGGL